MFSVRCEGHGAEVLLTDQHIEAVTHGEDGIVVNWKCYCGHRGSFVTGRGRRSPRSLAVA